MLFALKNYFIMTLWSLVEIILSVRYKFIVHGREDIQTKGAKSALQQTNNYLKQEKAVVLFPESSITYSGELAQFKRGFEKVVEGVNEGKIVPFYIGGMYGSRLFSRAKIFSIERVFFRRVVHLYFAKPMKIESNAQEVYAVVKELENQYNSYKNRGYHAT